MTHALKNLDSNWKNDATAINGIRNTHYDLGNYCESKGFDLCPDPDDMQKTFIARPGAEDFGDRIIGEINGDSEATITLRDNWDAE